MSSFSDTFLAQSRIDRLWPSPIALAWRKAENSRKRDELSAAGLRVALELTLRTSAAIMLAGYLPTEPDKAVESALAPLSKPALGHWLAIVRELARVHAARSSSPLQEAGQWLFSGKKPKSNCAFDTLVRAVESRNFNEHGTPLGTEREQRDWVVEYRADVLGVILSADWLAGWRVIRVTRTQHRHGKHRSMVQFLTGCDATPRASEVITRTALDDDGLFAVAPTGELVIDVQPFMAWGSGGKGGVDSLLVVKSIGENEMVLDGPGSGTPLTAQPSIEVDGKPCQVSPKSWMQDRTQLNYLVRRIDEQKGLSWDEGANCKGQLLGGQFDVRETLGVGGTAIVHRVFDRLLKEERAIKLLKRDLSVERMWIERFTRELQALREVRHPNVLADVSWGIIEGQPFLCMPLALGGTVRDRVTADGVGNLLSAELALRWLIQLLSALDAIHALGLVHRDVKPSNLLLDVNDDLLVCDLGVVLREGTDERLTQHGHLVGTPEYMAPEQLRGKALPASDVWSAGKIVDELARVVDWREESPFIHDELNELVRQMMADAAADRPSARVACDRLRSLLQKRNPPASRASAITAGEFAPGLNAEPDLSSNAAPELKEEIANLRAQLKRSENRNAATKNNLLTLQYEDRWLAMACEQRPRFKSAPTRDERLGRARRRLDESLLGSDREERVAKRILRNARRLHKRSKSLIDSADVADGLRKAVCAASISIDDDVKEWLRQGPDHLALQSDLSESQKDLRESRLTVERLESDLSYSEFRLEEALKEALEAWDANEERCQQLRKLATVAGLLSPLLSSVFIRFDSLLSGMARVDTEFDSLDDGEIEEEMERLESLTTDLAPDEDTAEGWPVEESDWVNEIQHYEWLLATACVMFARGVAGAVGQLSVVIDTANLEAGRRNEIAASMFMYLEQGCDDRSLTHDDILALGDWAEQLGGDLEAMSGRVYLWCCRNLQQLWADEGPPWGWRYGNTNWRVRQLLVAIDEFVLRLADVHGGEDLRLSLAQAKDTLFYASWDDYEEPDRDDEDDHTGGWGSTPGSRSRW